MIQFAALLPVLTKILGSGAGQAAAGAAAGQAAGETSGAGQPTTQGGGGMFSQFIKKPGQAASGIFSGLGSILSDEEAKNLQGSPDVGSILAKIYPERGGGGGEAGSALAQLADINRRIAALEARK